MAKAEKSRVEVVTVEDGVTLHLSMAEAKTLAAVGTKIGGDPDDTPRRHMDAINKALQEALASTRLYDWGWFDDFREAGTGGITFGKVGPRD